MSKLNKTLPVAALLGLCALIFFLRLHTYEEALERDVTIYAVIAHEMLDGRALYSDLWDHKPPAIYVTYAAAELIAGYGRDSIFLLNIAASFAALLGCYFAGSAAGGGRMGGFVAAGLWALASGDLALQGNQPNTELFLNAFLATGFAVFVRKEKNGLGLRGAVVAGVLFAVASLYKQVAVVQAGLLAFAYFASSPAGSRKKALAEMAILAAISVAGWALVISYFVAKGHGDAFREVVFTYNHYYSGSIWENLSQMLSWPSVSADVLAVMVSMAALSVVGIVLGLVFGPRRQWILFIAFCVATHICVLLPGRSFPHYYQLWLPPLAIGAGWAAALVKRILPASLSHLSYGVAGVACAILIALELPYYRLSAADWSAQKYGNIFLETDKLAYKINNLLSPSETFYEWGAESGLYFTSGRRPPSGVIFAYPMLAGPLAAKLSQRLLCDLERNRPDLIVVDGLALANTPRGNPVLKWFEENYRPFSKTNEFFVPIRHPPDVILAKDQFLLFVLKGGKLDAQKPGAGNEVAKSLSVSGRF
jgi:4-amino-4-deoxy-L-arabinose transferase-like glycosyltransferase